jgi:hypothetical protein
LLKIVGFLAKIWRKFGELTRNALIGKKHKAREQRRWRGVFSKTGRKRTR